MAWFKVDDGWWSHPKTLQLSDNSVSLWTRAGSWSCQHLTDGFIPVSALKTLGGTPRFAGELVKVGYWEKADGGWVFHDWADYQEHSATVKKRRGDARERMRAVRTNGKRTDESGSQEVRSTPTRPDPTRPLTTVIEVGGSTRSPRTPTPFCAKHPEGTDKPCRACQSARVAFEKPKATVSGIVTDPDCKIHPGRPKRGCDRCAEEAAA